MNNNMALNNKMFFSSSDSEQEEQEKETDLKLAFKEKGKETDLLKNKPRTCNWSKVRRDICSMITNKTNFFRHLRKFGPSCKNYRGITNEIIVPTKRKKTQVITYSNEKTIRLDKKDPGSILSHLEKNKRNNQPPMLLLPYDEETQLYTFVDLESSKMYHLKVPGIQESWMCGSSCGWLALVDNDLHLSLFNPLTLSVIKHPSTIPKIVDFAWDPSKYDPSKYNPAYYVQKVVLSDDPSSSNCLVFVIFDYGMLCACRLGGEWAVASSGPRCWHGGSFQGYVDVVFHQGKIFAVKDEFGPIDVFDYCNDLRFEKKIQKPWSSPSWVSFTKHLVNSCGQLLYVFRFIKTKEGKPHKTWRFEVYSLDPNMESWSRFDNLEEQSLFLGPTDSISISAKEFPWCKPNSIYFTQDAYDPSGYQWDNGLYSLEENHTIGKFDIRHSLSLWTTPAIWYQPTNYISNDGD